MRTRLIGIVLLALCAVEVNAQGFGDQPGLWVQVEGDWQSLTPTSVDIQAQVSGMLVQAQFTQSFHNSTEHWLEGKFAFPLPSKASVAGYRMRIGKRVIEGVVHEKQEARQVFERARKAGQTASLLVQNRDNLFTTELTNIAPGDSIQIELAYFDVLQFSDGLFSLHVPLGITPRFTPEGGDPVQTGTQAITEVNAEILLMPGSQLDLLESRHHDVDITELGGAYKVVMNGVDNTRDFDLIWMPRLGHEPKTAVYRQTVNGEHYVMMMMLPPESRKMATFPRDLVFVVDTSGSMEGESLRQAQQGLVTALESLTKQDRFTVLEFNSTTQALYPSMQWASDATIDTALDWVSQLRATGGTQMETALTDALAFPNDDHRLKQIVFLTDGAVSNEQQLFSLIHHGLGDARLFTVGFGPAPNMYFMRKAAQFGRGQYVRVGQISEAEEKLSLLQAQMQAPVLKNVCANFATSTEHYPQQLPDLYLGVPLVLIAKVAEPNSTLEVCGERLDTPFFKTLDMSKQQHAMGLDKLWARYKIDDLMDSLVVGADREQVKQMVTDVALAHQLSSAYTSFVAVDKTPNITRQLQQRRSMLNAGQPGLGASVPQTATHSTMAMLAGLVLILLAGALMWFGAIPRSKSA